MQAAATIRLTVARIPMELFSPVFGMGVGIPIPIGITLKHLLCSQLRMPEAYLENRIQTILVNGHAVDQVDRLALADGDVIALSAAMPGLAGAILRKGGALSPMRAAISQAPNGVRSSVRDRGIVKLKLFNMVAKEMGLQLLAGGIWLKGKVWGPMAAELGEGQDGAAQIHPDSWVEVFVSASTG
jgi:hypothetical protein